MIRKYIIEAEDSLKGFEEEIAKLEREWGIEEIEPCDDCISREAVEEITFQEPSYTDPYNVLTEVRDKVRDLPSVTPERPKGKWIHREDMDYLDENKVMHIHFMCQDCGFIHDFIDGHTAQYKYCPSCGMKME
jgi:rubrerythrin